MSRSKFMVIKLSDLKVPIIMLAIAIAVFSYFLLSSNDATQTFAPDTSYEDGMYIANIAFSDAAMDVVVSVLDKEITSIALDGFDETERTVYQDLQNSLSFVNDYITSTQSLELPEASNISASTSILMDAVKVALSDDQNAMITSTYQAPLLEQITEATTTPEGEAVVLEEEATIDEGTAKVEDTATDEVATEDVSVEEGMATDEAAATEKAPSTEAKPEPKKDESKQN